jgi:predicted metal-dependent hydrolase
MDHVDDQPVSATELPYTVEVIRSPRRRKTVGASVRGGSLRVTIPSWMSVAEEQRWVDTMTQRFVRARSTERIDLVDRARVLAARHDLPLPAVIRWSDDMTTRWGSCTPATRTVRLSTRLGAFPDWVIDYVIVHELAHLLVPGHDDRFWAIVHRYPRAERAIGYLMAKSGEVD